MLFDDFFIRRINNVCVCACVCASVLLLIQQIDFFRRFKKQQRIQWVLNATNLTYISIHFNQAQNKNA